MTLADADDVDGGAIEANKRIGIHNNVEEIKEGSDNPSSISLPNMLG